MQSNDAPSPTSFLGRVLIKRDWRQRPDQCPLGLLCGLKSDISRGPRSASFRTSRCDKAESKAIAAALSGRYAAHVRDLSSSGECAAGLARQTRPGIFFASRRRPRSSWPSLQALKAPAHDQRHRKLVRHGAAWRWRLLSCGAIRTNKPAPRPLLSR
jgi:hypothetical protein